MARGRLPLLLQEVFALMESGVCTNILILAGSVCGFALADPALPQDVCILPVSLTDDEATALRDFPVEWMTR